MKLENIIMPATPNNVIFELHGQNILLQIMSILKLQTSSFYIMPIV